MDNFQFYLQFLMSIEQDLVLVNNQSLILVRKTLKLYVSQIRLRLFVLKDVSNCSNYLSLPFNLVGKIVNINCSLAKFMLLEILPGKTFLRLSANILGLFLFYVFRSLTCHEVPR